MAVIAEGVPERDTKHLIAVARRGNKVVLGPATVGGVQAGAFKIADAAGTLDNILACRLYRPGCVGFVSKSGGMSNELYNVIARAADGVYEGVAIGGDAFPGSTLSDHCLRYQNIPGVAMIVVLGEIGGRDEYSLVEALASGAITKPVVAWVSGTCATLFATEVQFGHAGAKSGGDDESAQAKNAALAAAGAVVPASFEDLEATIARVYRGLVDAGRVTPARDDPPPAVPEDLAAAKRAGRVRVPTHVVSSICDDRGEEPTYNGVSMSELMQGDATVADAIGCGGWWWVGVGVHMGGECMLLSRRLPADMAPYLAWGAATLLQSPQPPQHHACPLSTSYANTPPPIPPIPWIHTHTHTHTLLRLLWFKRRLPGYATKFIEMCVVLCADHGPCVSGAHNTIVTARAGKDLISSLVSGLLTIGPRFGGAIDGAAQYFKEAVDEVRAVRERGWLGGSACL